MISVRLRSIIDMVPLSDTIADIGCDHGKVAVALIKEGKASRAVCSDISGRSLDKARKRVKAKKMEAQISLREGDGLSVLSDGEADVVVLAGMGGELIADILAAGQGKIPDTLVLSCNTASGKLRKWLCTNGYYITDEAIEYENRRYYPIILAKRGQSAELSDIELEFGPILLKKKPKPLKHFVRKRIEKTKVIKSKISKSTSDRKEMLMRELEDRLEKYKELEKMPVEIDDVVAMIEKIAPRDLAYDWDNTGLLIRCSSEVHDVLIALDVTQAVVDEAIEQGCDMILAHHPTMFDTVRSLSIDNVADAVTMRLVRAGISLYAAHTSYDRAQSGMNDVLAKKLGLTDVVVIDGHGDGLMRTGCLPKPMDGEAFVQHVKQALGIKYLKISRGGCDSILRVAVVGGSGGDFVSAAKKEGMDALVTGEVKHHHFIEAAALGVLLAEAGHFDTEHLFVDDVFMSLQSCANEVQLRLGLKKATCESAPYIYK